jgi:hypothetical protein
MNECQYSIFEMIVKNRLSICKVCVVTKQYFLSFDGGGIGEHPSGPSAVFEDELRELCGIGEHPSECNAERVTFISPRGEMGQVRPALGPEGCPVIPY